MLVGKRSVWWMLCYNVSAIIKYCFYLPYIFCTLFQESPHPGHNIKFKGPNGVQRRKTEMCENFKAGKCGWGNDCNYAHSKEELKTANEVTTSQSRPNSYFTIIVS